MRHDKLDLPPAPDNDRPGDHWMHIAGDHPGDLRAVRTWTGRRRRISVCFLIVCVLLATTALALVGRADLFQPGDLSDAHAQVLGGATSESCGACHTDAAQSPLDWFSRGGQDHAGVTQSDLCLQCHHRTIPRNFAFAAHNLPLSVREQLTESIRVASAGSDPAEGLSLHRMISSTGMDQNNVQCKVCHQEHHGADADLRSLSDAQCQSCHLVQFGSFADSHPDWGRWPYGRGGEISFDHASHQLKHFPQWKSGQTRFDCAICHPDSGQVKRSAGYQASCQGCHDDSLELQTNKGIGLVALPMLPQSVAEQVTNWPESATGFADGVIPPLMELLLRVDPQMAAVLRAIPNGDLSRLDADDPATRDQLLQLADHCGRLLKELAVGGHPVIETRLAKQGISAQSLSPVLGTLSPQLIESAIEHWFSFDRPNIASELLSQSNAIPFDQRVSSGGWYRDDNQLTLQYRGSGHADPVLVAVIETFAQLGETDPLKKRFFTDVVVSSCVSCHASANSVPSVWRATAFEGQRNQFTKFNHQPHLNVSQLGRCDHCHRINADRLVDPKLAEFQPLQQATCAECHTAKSAGDQCTTCHRYHIQ
ncbi:hypothetical protein NHH03_04200 [Stieleria sp. TO1_6]|uniref:hypothetical protein n=1 Tax=Stieleria tagensis TaxID=2956795 RepID=UPI00209B21D2|nr:hypothetical protein [Stieleria tagensis]MCO8120928.1 hypothetical protein [Stieleria tagensis]